MRHSRTLQTLLASTIFIFANIGSVSATELIELKGLSIASTVSDIESVFGRCSAPDENGWRHCGGSDTNAYRDNDDNSKKEVYFECEILKACNYPIEILAKIIQSKREAIIDYRLESWSLGKTATLYGVAGDIMILRSFSEDGKVSFISLHQGEALSLD